MKRLALLGFAEGLARQDIAPTIFDDSDRAANLPKFRAESARQTSQ
jgi:hypothetical protein